MAWDCLEASEYVFGIQIWQFYSKERKRKPSCNFIVWDLLIKYLTSCFPVPNFGYAESGTRSVRHESRRVQKSTCWTVVSQAIVVSLKLVTIGILGELDDRTACDLLIWALFSPVSVYSLILLCLGARHLKHKLAQVKYEQFFFWVQMS